ncbi:MAG: dienelactone hydrolase family protein [Burkholderiaceae bacterium]
MTQFERPDGQKVAGYLARPRTAVPGPGIVVIQEWWGLNDQIKGVADRFAEAGYTALVPDLYRGKKTAEAEEANHLMTSLDFGDAAGQDIRGAVSFLKQHCARVGVTGFCMGGALTVLAACNVPEMDAGVPYYGYPPLEYVDASKIKVPLMGHYAIDDVPFPIANVDKLEEMLAAAGVDAEIHRYKAQHAFANETAVGANKLPITEYNPEAAELAWTRTLAFFDKHLS